MSLLPHDFRQTSDYTSAKLTGIAVDMQVPVELIINLAKSEPLGGHTLPVRHLDDERHSVVAATHVALPS